MPVDVFQHDNGTVNEHPNTQCQAAQCHDVECQAACCHQDRGNQYRYGNRAANDQRATQTAQKQIDCDHGQYGTADRCSGGVVQGAAYVPGFVVNR